MDTLHHLHQETLQNWYISIFHCVFVYDTCEDSNIFWINMCCYYLTQVLSGTYNGMKLRATEQAIISDNEQSEEGQSLPVEILPAGEFQPLYRTTLNVQVNWMLQ
jgi:hypothetical protein